ncbi:MAG: zinc ribbon domain-containing protein [Candidatus Riflebacteria bacterium]|nr:zinc ribbon domain-containing protein [Candidatus Riflebacteria bacterium]
MKKLFIILSALILSAVSPLYASFCTHCGKKLVEAANFCSNCGHAVGNTNNTSSCDYNSNNNLTTTRTRVVYNDGVNSTSTVRTISAYVPNTETQIVYKNEYYYPTPVTRTVVVREPVCDPLFGLMVWGIVHHNHHHHHHRHFAPAPVRHMPPPPPSRRGPIPGGRRAGFRH